MKPFLITLYMFLQLLQLPQYSIQFEHSKSQSVFFVGHLAVREVSTDSVAQKKTEEEKEIRES